MKIYEESSEKLLKKSILFGLISDLHVHDKKGLEKLRTLVDKYLKQKPDYMLFMGDYVHDSLKDQPIIEELMKELELLTREIPSYGILGNHDSLTKVNGEWLPYCSLLLVANLNGLTNFQLLAGGNWASIDGGVSISGVTFSGGFYELDQEDKLEYRNSRNFYGKMPDETYNIVLQHSPNNIMEEEIVKEIPFFDNVDMAISGHQHNGLVPSNLDFLPTNRGFVGYQGSKLCLLRKNCRGIKNVTGTMKGIIVSPVTTIADGNIRFLDDLYPAEEQYLLLKRK